MPDRTDENEHLEHQDGDGQMPQDPLSPNGSPQTGEQQGNPEPPVNWMPPSNAEPPGSVPSLDERPELDVNSRMGAIGRTIVELNGQAAADFGSARKYVMAAQISAVISLFIGGVLLSAVSLVLAILGYRKLAAVSETLSGQPDMRAAFRRSGLVAIVIACLSLVVNAISLVVLYPVVMQAMQQGDLSSLMGGAHSGAAPQGSSAGSSLFG